MTFIWILVWIIVAGAVLGFLGWSANLTLAQKKAWSAFALKYKLVVTPSRKLLDPISITGTIAGRRLNIYVSVEQNDRERMARNYTHIEVFLHIPLSIVVLMAKKPLPEIFGGQVFVQNFTTPSKEFPQLAVAQASDVYAMANWLTPARMTALRQYMDADIRGAEPMLICDGLQSYLMMRTSDPLRDPRELNAMVQKLFEVAKELEREGAAVPAAALAPVADEDDVSGAVPAT